MDDAAKLRHEAEASELRARLKRWENDWADGHGGTKPGRQDIKDNPDIARQYKEYNTVRDILSGKAPPPSTDASSPRKRRSDAPSETPLKRAKHAQTPSKDRTRDDEVMNTPAISRRLFSPAQVTSLGPTPQRDGRVLGLFDLLVGRELGTPSKKYKETGGKGGRQNNLQATPSKRTSTSDLDDDDGRLGRTPMSASKRQLLNTFMTPLKSRKENLGGGTPTSVSKLQFDTPAFLKRHALPTLDEDGTFDTPAPLRLPRKPMVRGLSEIVASLRKVEDDRLDDDDDLDALREAESAELGTDEPKPPSQAPPPPRAPADVLVEDGHGRRLPLGGFDDESLYDSPVEEALDRGGNPLVAYKKKGQKRTTRKANIKPTRTKRPAATAEREDGDEDGEDTVLDTQAAAGASTQAAAAGDPDAGFVDEGRGSNGAEPSRDDAKKEGTVKKAVRKVNELAHANFQRLKLRNYGAKGGPGYDSRFRRRR
ncbi:DNA replication regulator SLD2 [Tolypocladium capitatum]|uniref:DNA replication regulator SLD2 n=1 Tax=Tolypocladium capitatum TaxID=45235 RepID=A0A2K3QBI3_9HYPO|nr:DNA replication regulator SLD2 [Tolypocladium capitatum]